MNKQELKTLINSLRSVDQITTRVATTAENLATGFTEAEKQKIKSGDFLSADSKISNAVQSIQSNPKTKQIFDLVKSRQAFLEPIVKTLRLYIQDPKQIILITAAVLVCITAFIYFKHKKSSKPEAVLDCLELSIMEQEDIKDDKKQKLIFSAIVTLLFCACFATDYIRNKKTPTAKQLALFIISVLLIGVLSYKSPNVLINTLEREIFRHAIKAVIS